MAQRQPAAHGARTPQALIGKTPGNWTDCLIQPPVSAREDLMSLISYWARKLARPRGVPVEPDRAKPVTRPVTGQASSGFTLGVLHPPLLDHGAPDHGHIA